MTGNPERFIPVIDEVHRRNRQPGIDGRAAGRCGDRGNLADGHRVAARDLRTNAACFGDLFVRVMNLQLTVGGVASRSFGHGLPHMGAVVGPVDDCV